MGMGRSKGVVGRGSSGKVGGGGGCRGSGKSSVWNEFELELEVKLDQSRGSRGSASSIVKMSEVGEVKSWFVSRKNQSSRVGFKSESSMGSVSFILKVKIIERRVRKFMASERNEVGSDHQ